MDVLRSELLKAHGFRHGFSLRVGGVSEAPFDTLNLGWSVGDEEAAVHENRRRFFAEVGFAAEQVFEVSQVHGAVVETLRAGATVSSVRAREADALVCPPGMRAAVGVRIADCAPVLLADRATGAVAAVHVGWRGAVARVIEATLGALRDRAGTSAGDVLAAVGPHIGPQAFDVGAEVAAQLAGAAHGAPVVRMDCGRIRVDLLGVIRTQLEALGVAPAHIDVVSGCTYSDPARFFSFRRDGVRSGRHLAIIGN